MVYTAGVASILIKDIPPELHERLREAAARDHRSLNREVIALLEKALTVRPTELPPPIKLSVPLTQELLDEAIADGQK
jgi:plasmid stability protein